MAGVRDPAFWKRFSVAVHLDEEQGPEKNDSNSWLARQKRKGDRGSYICGIFWLCFAIFVAAIVAVIIWLLSSGVLSNIRIGNDASSAQSSATATASATSTASSTATATPMYGVNQR